jgi:hypothetical protein
MKTQAEKETWDVLEDMHGRVHVNDALNARQGMGIMARTEAKDKPDKKVWAYVAR